MKIRKTISALCAAAMLLCAAPFASAAGDDIHEPAPYSLLTITNNRPIDNLDLVWEQPGGNYKYYRIQIVNTSDNPIKCTMTFPKVQTGDMALDGAVLTNNASIAMMLSYIAPMSTVTATNNLYAQPGQYQISFTYDTPSGGSPGTISVEASTTQF